ncbi:hypothetical protein HZH68_009235 [Vespula germanica]|uniref:Uncharacterized protein n=1 Tax=Vespula germanica TaxID=30212 RepID=A0A834JW26_VESGE|nr:hypothetical protein HZH68_009235 [Vespula germanica]
MSPACVRMDVDVDTLEFRGRVEPPSREDGDQYCNPQEQNQLEACSFEEKKNRHLGCLHPVGHFRHARRHVALLPPAVVLLATSPFLDDP